MLIDWFTVAAQIVNFLILVWLLRRFLYGPIVKAMEAREARIKGQLNEATDKLRSAEEAGQRYERDRAELHDQREDILRQARQEAETKRHDLLEEARAEFRAAQARWQRLLEQEQTSFQHDVRQRVGAQTLVIARQALGALANTGLEQQIVVVFADKLGRLDADTRAPFKNAGRLRLVTAFDLPEDARASLRQALAEHIGPDSAPDFVVDPTALAGIELRTDGHKIAWSLNGYLDDLEQRLAESPDTARGAA